MRLALPDVPVMGETNGYNLKRLLMPSALPQNYDIAVTRISKITILFFVTNILLKPKAFAATELANYPRYARLCLALAKTSFTFFNAHNGKMRIRQGTPVCQWHYESHLQTKEANKKLCRIWSGGKIFELERSLFS